MFTGLLQISFVRFSKLLQQLATSLWITSFDNQLATSLLTTCNRLVVNKLSQAMRTHPDIGLLVTSMLQDKKRLVVTCALLIVYVSTNTTKVPFCRAKSICYQCHLFRFCDSGLKCLFDEKTGVFKDQSRCLPSIHISLMRIWVAWLEKFPQDFRDKPTLKVCT